MQITYEAEIYPIPHPMGHATNVTDAARAFVMAEACAIATMSSRVKRPPARVV